MLNPHCPLCHNPAEIFYKNEFYICSTCLGIFRSRASLLNPIAEKTRYEQHNNDVHDPRYQQFVSPITDAVLKNFSPQQQGLDFGAGTGSAIAKVLEDSGYSIKQYDPFFHDHPELLEEQYDYITCCEVIEHFHNPAREFERLTALLKPQGSLYCMTVIYHAGHRFEDWYYKNDPTHVFFYQKATLQWIQINYGFSTVLIEDRMIQFVN